MKSEEHDLAGPDTFAVGEWCYALAEELWPLPRFLTGNAVRATLQRLKVELPPLHIHSVESGSKAFDWDVPPEWNIRAAYIEDEAGNRVVDFADNNLHIVGYSEPVDVTLSLDDLQEHLYSLPDQPDAIPYVTSYYRRRWGFCLSQHQRDSLADGFYRVVIDADIAPGVLNYGELLIPGETEDEVFLSTYVCHPSMANNELSGPVVTAALAKWLLAQPSLKYSYRIVFIPETIGSLVYLSRNLETMRKHVRAGFNVSCVGDDRCYSYLPSRDGDTISDHVALHVLKHLSPGFKRYTWLDRGSDERQYCAPGADLPVATIMRSKYGEYPEYHTSLDTLGGVVTSAGLAGGYEALKSAITILEKDFTPLVTTIGEPQLGKRGLYPDLSQKGSANHVKDMMNMISYCDGRRSLLQIAELLGLRFDTMLETAAPLLEEGLLIKRR